MKNHIHKHAPRDVLSDFASVQPFHQYRCQYTGVWITEFLRFDVRIPVSFTDEIESFPAWLASRHTPFLDPRFNTWILLFCALENCLFVWPVNLRFRDRKIRCREDTPPQSWSDGWCLVMSVHRLGEITISTSKTSGEHRLFFRIDCTIACQRGIKWYSHDCCTKQLASINSFNSIIAHFFRISVGFPIRYFSPSLKWTSKNQASPPFTRTKKMFSWCKPNYQNYLDVTNSNVDTTSKNTQMPKQIVHNRKTTLQHNLPQLNQKTHETIDNFALHPLHQSLFSTILTSALRNRYSDCRSGCWNGNNKHLVMD